MSEPGDHDPNDDGGRRGPLAALALIAALVAAGLYIAHELRATSDIQDCVMAGRKNCAPIDAGTK